jgi:membrane-associated phospholipid phosphatase
MTGVEAYCLALDRRIWTRLGIDTLTRRAPRAVLEVLEFIYVATFLYVPACVVVVAFIDRSLVDRSWALVLLGEYGAFAMLPWIQTRPPRSVEPPGPLDRRPLLARELNRFMVRNTSIQVNTLPSGHVSGSFAAATALWSVSLPAGIVSVALAVLISISAVVGRYHYAIDAVTGVGVAVVAGAIVTALI